MQLASILAGFVTRYYEFGFFNAIIGYVLLSENYNYVNEQIKVKVTKPVN